VAATASRNTEMGVTGGPSNGGAPVAEPEVWIVIVLVAGFPPGVTVAGEKVQVLPAGKPAQENDTGALSGPPAGVIVRVEVPDWPRVIVKVFGCADILKFSLTVWVSGAEVLDANFESPSYLAMIWCVPGAKEETV
jgi:hypothetical protein